jgi:hypothetical protein
MVARRSLKMVMIQHGIKSNVVNSNPDSFISIFN